MKLIMKCLLLFSSLFLLTACQRETMIQFSEENREKIEAKKEGLSLNIKSKNLDETLEEKSTKLTFNKDNWVEAKQIPTLLIEDFLPMQENQIKIFTDGSQQKYLYLKSQDPEKKIQNLLQLKNKELSLEIYSWQQESLSRGIFQEEIYPLAMNEAVQDWEQVCQFPLAGDSTRLKEANIQAFFSEIQIDEEVYNNVLEIKLSDKLIYLAQGKGLVAEETETETWWLINSYPNVKLISKINLFLPQNSTSSLLSSQETTFTWQTNQNLAKYFTEWLQANKIIGLDIQVNQIKFITDYVQVDFSPGVVASLNQHPQGEQAAIASIIANIKLLTGIDKVQLTVNNYGMLPDTFPYPDNAMYYFNPEWLSKSFDSPFGYFENQTETTIQLDLSN